MVVLPTGVRIHNFNIFNIDFKIISPTYLQELKYTDARKKMPSDRKVEIELKLQSQKDRKAKLLAVSR